MIMTREQYELNRDAFERPRPAPANGIGGVGEVLGWLNWTLCHMTREARDAFTSGWPAERRSSWEKHIKELRIEWVDQIQTIVLEPGDIN